MKMFINPIFFFYQIVSVCSCKQKLSNPGWKVVMVNEAKTRSIYCDEMATEINAYKVALSFFIYLR